MRDGVERARVLLAGAADRLGAAGTRDEALGEYVEPKPVLGIRRDPTIRSLGRVWRVGALLLGSSPETAGRVWSTGSITRVTEAGRAQFVSVSAEVRRAYRAAAAKGHFAPGDTVNHGATPIPPRRLPGRRQRHAVRPRRHPPGSAGRRRRAPTCRSPPTSTTASPCSSTHPAARPTERRCRCRVSRVASPA
ncbi:hypothetical protein [Curtobacterium sp. MCJR17_043]|uniref:hypothetical protein n=1 Tax=Curtobacterium sp. MCJR17_043 TaxID=2175660 RepID=UPI0024DF34D4|nr:hypothetical protein [Curtobacterium sp. MCJR17_043]WIB35491.1 hypothetical protein DEJ15_14855 [Curtobacterium sp. MCJR17_043]